MCDPRRFRDTVHRVGRALVVGGIVLGLPAGAVAAVPLKVPSDAPRATGAVAFARAGAPSALLVTFAGVPDRAEVALRLAGLGAIRPVAPEAGVWRLIPRRGDIAVRGRAARRPGVAAAEWALVRTIAQSPPAPGPPTAPVEIAEPLDPEYALGVQWGLRPGRGGTWSPALTTVGPRPRIAILDSGVDRTHEEWRGPDSPLVAPRDVIHRTADAGDWGLTGHGTHVAGIAAAPINGVGIVGVAPAGPGAGEVIPVRIASPDGHSTDQTMIAGIRWAVLHGARVINISAGGPGDTRALQDTIYWATNRGALIVASVGNDGMTPDARTVNYPSGYRRVLGVGAQCDGEVSADCPVRYGPARFSNRNDAVDVIAPGVKIVSTVPRRVVDDALAVGYAYKDGTSMAAPYVTGVAALVQAANGGRLSPYQVLRQIQNTARRLGPGGRNARRGYGVVDAAAAVTRPAPPDDVGEVNDDIKWVGRPAVPTPTAPVRITASADHEDDREDVYPVYLRKGDVYRVRLEHRTGRLDLYLWGPGARTVATDGANVRRNLVGVHAGDSRRKGMTRTATRSGVHHVNVYARTGRGDYTLTVTIRRRGA